MLDVHFIKVNRVVCGAFVELESEKDVKLALSCSCQCVNATYGRVLGMCYKFCV